MKKRVSYVDGAMAKSRKPQFFIGTASWTIPKQSRDDFFPPKAVKPNHLLAYSAKLTGVEINSSFYREHQGKTYLKWAESTPENFRFAVKLAKRFTHVQKLKVDATDLKVVLEGILQLGEKLGTLLVQIPPKLAFDEGTAEDFFATIRDLYDGAIVFEPRHETWASREATRVLEDYRVARVVADPNRIGDAPIVKSAEISYFRLHGSPKVYYSNYTKRALDKWVNAIEDVASKKAQTWCIFDNTALGHATPNALYVQKQLLKKFP